MSFFSITDLLDIEGIKKLYYESLQDVRLEKPADHESHAGDTSRYHERIFKQWAEKVNIWELEKNTVNFALAEDIVTSFEKYYNTVDRKLSTGFHYNGVNLPGQLRNIGSCWDGSKVGKLNEFDSLYVMNDGPFTIKASNKPDLYHVFINKTKLRPRQLRDKFADHMSRLISELKLPNGLTHGGFNSLRKRRVDARKQTGETVYSGARYNGPAVTSQFLTDERTLLTWNVTPCIVVTNDNLQKDVRKIIQPVIDDNPKKHLPQYPIHLIPDPLEDCWRVSTAHLEAEMLRYLSDEAPAKKALVLCKILLSLLKQWNQENEVPTICPVTLKILKQLDCHIESGKSQNQALLEWMRFAHIWIPSHKGGEYNEGKKVSISINTAAVTHIIMRAGFQEKGAFAASSNDDIVLKLMQIVFQTLGNDTDFASDHALLSGTRISHFSVAASNAHNKVSLARSVCQQCRTLLADAMTEVRADLKKKPACF